MIPPVEEGFLVAVGVLVGAGVLVGIVGDTEGVCVGDFVGVEECSGDTVTTGLVCGTGASDTSGVVKSSSGSSMTLRFGLGVTASIPGVADGSACVFLLHAEKQMLTHKINNANKTVCLTFNRIIITPVNLVFILRSLYHCSLSKSIPIIEWFL